MAEPSPSTTTLSMPLEEAMRTQRAIRRLKPDPVDDTLVLHLIELALRALEAVRDAANGLVVPERRRHRQTSSRAAASRPSVHVSQPPSRLRTSCPSCCSKRLAVCPRCPTLQCTMRGASGSSA